MNYAESVTISVEQLLLCQVGLLDGVIAVYSVGSAENHPHYDTMYVISALFVQLTVTVK